jgi:CubicO group peptidase (beta-lactamase class C family)
MNDTQTIFQIAADEAVAAGEIGIQIAVYKDGQLVASVCGGMTDKASGRKVDENTLFNAFSCCKALTNSALHLQATRGLIDYRSRVADYWPEFAANGKSHCTVEDVLAHRAGVPQMPEGVTPARMADFGWMTRQLAAMKPMFEPGSVNAYHSYTQGWIIGELVQRTDPKGRDIRQFILDEIALPLGMSDVWYGVPESEDYRVARLYGVGVAGLFPADSAFLKSVPPAVDLSPEVWELDVVRRSCIPGAGAHFTARSEVRFWAMLAEGGALDGVRLFTPSQVSRFSVARPGSDQPDALLGYPCNISTRGFWLRGSEPSVGTSERLLAQAGAGKSMAWADPDNRIAVAVCHNRFGDAYKEPLRRAMAKAFKIG